MASARRPGPVQVEVELLDVGRDAPSGLSPEGESAVFVTKSGRGAAASLLAVSLVVALGAWQLLTDPATVGPTSIDRATADQPAFNPEFEQRLTDVLTGPAPSPTIRWETPPRFGGRGDDYSEVGSPARTPFRPGPYR